LFKGSGRMWTRINYMKLVEEEEEWRAFFGGRS
jgi:hypothetical protein